MTTNFLQELNKKWNKKFLEKWGYLESVSIKLVSVGNGDKVLWDSSASYELINIYIEYKLNQSWFYQKYLFMFEKYQVVVALSKSFNLSETDILIFKM